MKLSSVLSVAALALPAAVVVRAEDNDGDKMVYITTPIFRHPNSFEHHVELTFGRASTTQELSLDLGSEGVSINCDKISESDTSLQPVECSSDEDCYLQASTCRRGQKECMLNTIDGHPLNLGYKAFEFTDEKSRIGGIDDRREMTPEMDLLVACQDRLGTGYDSYPCDGMLGLSGERNSFSKQL